MKNEICNAPNCPQNEIASQQEFTEIFFLTKRQSLVNKMPQKRNYWQQRNAQSFIKTNWQGVANEYPEDEIADSKNTQ